MVIHDVVVFSGESNQDRTVAGYDSVTPAYQDEEEISNSNNKQSFQMYGAEN